MKPVKAFLYQDHQAHIQVHMNAMQDPKISALIGQNPQAQAIAAAATAHISEHLAFEYRKQMEEMLGIPLPTGEEDEGMPKEMEVQISIMAAKASDALLNRNKTEVAAQQAQQAAQDPVIQMQAKELELKKAEEERKTKKDLMDAAAQADKIAIDEERIKSAERIAGAQIGAKTAKDQNEMEFKKLQEGIKVGQTLAQSNKPQTGSKE
jgi:glycerol-3-phosphate dehydrogenase